MDHSEFIDFLLEKSRSETENLPALKDLSQQIGISISTLREQFMEFCDELNLDAMMEPMKV